MENKMCNFYFDSTDFDLLSIELLSNTSVFNGNVREWGYLQTGNGSVLTALVDKKLSIFKLQLDQPYKPLSNARTLQSNDLNRQ